ncbi:hypothetical protein EXIGLDRAFT_448514 [Exidia glandulosa HHB12029]|uniref:Uncharacterized protein n=1 Tax=Exidia glandulosa HHB12029 TaxID=1314781 RepID=A0A165B4R4_EXIGL|nr:hypothetical protein EXIGLDRAFT_448514 [Exidia glandulosa HHB12029]
MVSWYRALQGRSRGLLPLARFRACSLLSCSGLQFHSYNTIRHAQYACRRLKTDLVVTGAMIPFTALEDRWKILPVDAMARDTTVQCCEPAFIPCPPTAHYCARCPAAQQAGQPLPYGSRNFTFALRALLCTAWNAGDVRLLELCSVSCCVRVCAFTIFGASLPALSSPTRPRAASIACRSVKISTPRAAGGRH